MRAVQCQTYGSIDDLSLATLDDPAPGPGQVAIDVRAAGINFPDVLIVQGQYQARPELPFVPGGECSGVIRAVGDGVEGWSVGDPVIAMDLVGAFAEVMVVDAGSVIPKPPSLDFAAAAGIAITYGTSYYALKQRARLAPGETLLVLGAAGGVGLAAVELGKIMGARVIAAASTDAKLDAAREAGADDTILYTSEPLKQQIKALTGGRGANVVLDPVGGDFSEQALRATAWDGRHLVVGFAAGAIPKIPLNLTLLKGASICGVFWGTWTQKDPAGSRQNMDELAGYFADRRLRPRITTYPLAEFSTAITTLAERKAIGKVVLDMTATG